MLLLLLLVVVVVQSALETQTERFSNTRPPYR
jgi:hypothetical protein